MIRFSSTNLLANYLLPKAGIPLIFVESCEFPRFFEELRTCFCSPFQFIWENCSKVHGKIFGELLSVSIRIKEQIAFINTLQIEMFWNRMAKNEKKITWKGFKLKVHSQEELSLKTLHNVELCLAQVNQ